MKKFSIKLLSFAFVVSASIGQSLAMASPIETRSGAGGDLVRLPDGRLVLGDIFLDYGASQPDDRPPQKRLRNEVLQEARRIYRAFVSGAVNRIIFLKQDSLTDVIRTIGALMNPDKNELRFFAVQSVEELNNYCASGGKKSYELPGGVNVMQAACTAGRDTYYIEPIFRDPNLSLTEKTLLLIHERLTTVRDQFERTDFVAVAMITNGLRKLTQISEEQNAGTMRILTVEEIAILETMYRGYDALVFRNGSGTGLVPISIHPYGGGQVIGSVSRNAFVDSKSLVEAQRNFSVGSGAIIQNSYLRQSQVGTNARIQDSDLDGPISIGPNAEIHSSQLEFQSKIGSNSKLEKVVAAQRVGHINPSAKFEVGDNSEVRNIISPISLRIGSDSVVSDSKFGGPTTRSYDTEVGKWISLGSFTGKVGFVEIGSQCKIADLEWYGADLGNALLTHYGAYYTESGKTDIEKIESKLKIASRSNIENSKLFGPIFEFLGASRVSNSEITGSIHAIGDFEMDRSNLSLITKFREGWPDSESLGFAKIAPNQKIADATMIENFMDYAGAQEKLLPIDLNYSVSIADPIEYTSFYAMLLGTPFWSVKNAQGQYKVDPKLSKKGILKKVNMLNGYNVQINYAPVCNDNLNLYAINTEGWLSPAGCTKYIIFDGVHEGSSFQEELERQLTGAGLQFTSQRHSSGAVYITVTLKKESI